MLADCLNQLGFTWVCIKRKTRDFRTVYGVNRDPFQPVLSDVELRIVTWRIRFAFVLYLATVSLSFTDMRISKTSNHHNGHVFYRLTDRPCCPR
jgi:hypothetical protein